MYEFVVGANLSTNANLKIEECFLTILHAEQQL